MKYSKVWNHLESPISQLLQWERIPSSLAAQMEVGCVVHQWCVSFNDGGTWWFLTWRKTSRFLVFPRVWQGSSEKDITFVDILLSRELAHCLRWPFHQNNFSTALHIKLFILSQQLLAQIDFDHLWELENPQQKFIEEKSVGRGLLHQLKHKDPLGDSVF